VRSFLRSKNVSTSSTTTTTTTMATSSPTTATTVGSATASAATAVGSTTSSTTSSTTTVATTTTMAATSTTLSAIPRFFFFFFRKTLFQAQCGQPTGGQPSQYGQSGQVQQFVQPQQPGVQKKKTLVIGLIDLSRTTVCTASSRRCCICSISTAAHESGRVCTR
jgi:hypothetical protein